MNQNRNQKTNRIVNQMNRCRTIIHQKTLAAALLASVFFLLSGCGTNAPADTVTDSGRARVTFWYSGGKTAARVMEEIIDSFNQSQSKYTVTGIQQADYDETYTKLQAGIAGKNAADIALLDSDKARNLMKKELLVRLDRYTDQDDSFDKDSLIPVFHNQCLWDDGALYAMPAYGTTQVMYYNRRLFETAGIRPDSIQTWEDLAEAAETIQQSTGGSACGWEPMWGEDNLIDMALSNGGTMLSDDSRTVLINSPQWIETWETVRKWIHEDDIMAVHYGGQGWEYWYDTMDDVLQDKAGGYTGSSGDQADLDFTKVGAMEQPRFGDNPAAPVARVLQLVMVDTGKDKTKDGAYMFMKYFADAPQQARWSMATGYIPVRRTTLDIPEYQSYTEENPQALVPLAQAMHASPDPIDPTGGKIFDALSIAADKVEIENVPAADALNEAAETAQAALDETYKNAEAVLAAMTGHSTFCDVQNAFRNPHCHFSCHGRIHCAGDLLHDGGRVPCVRGLRYIHASPSFSQRYILRHGPDPAAV